MTDIEMGTADRVCIVGAGPGGLLVARQLHRAGVEYDHYERHSDSGGLWDPQNAGSPMYRSAHFVSSKTLSGFPGFPMPDDYPDYPSWKQILEYIRSFARHEGLQEKISFGSTVESAVLCDDHTWDITVNGRIKRYRALVAIPGQTWHPHIPRLAGADTFTGRIMHSSEYDEPSIFRGKRVVVVGAGNSGVDIVCDAATSADTTFFSVRRGYRFIPKHVFGMPFDVFLNAGGRPPEWVTVPGDPNEFIDCLVGDLTRLGLPAPDHSVLQTHPIVNDRVIHHLTHGDITAKGDIDHLDGDEVVFIDGSREKVDVILLATGYEHRAPFLDESLLHDEDGRVDMYMNMFSRKTDTLAVLGFIVLAGAAYTRYDEMARLIAVDLALTGDKKAEFAEQKRTHRPDLRGGMVYLDTRRNEDYVENVTYATEVARLTELYGADVPGAALVAG